MTLTRDQLEFTISRLLDGDLAPAEQAELAKLFAADPSARQLFEQLKAIDDYFRKVSGLPAVQWDRLADTISAAVAEQHLPPVNASANAGANVGTPKTVAAVSYMRLAE